MLKPRIIITLFVAMTMSITTSFSQQWIGLNGGMQTITQIISERPKFSHSVYLIGFVGHNRWTFNVQPIMTVLPYNGFLFKIGVDYTFFYKKTKG